MKYLLISLSLVLLVVLFFPVNVVAEESKNLEEYPPEWQAILKDLKADSEYVNQIELYLIHCKVLVLRVGAARLEWRSEVGDRSDAQLKEAFRHLIFVENDLATDAPTPLFKQTHQAFLELFKQVRTVLELERELRSKSDAKLIERANVEFKKIDQKMGSVMSEMKKAEKEFDLRTEKIKQELQEIISSGS